MKNSTEARAITDSAVLIALTFVIMFSINVSSIIGLIISIFIYRKF